MEQLPLDVVLSIRNEMRQGMQQAITELRNFRAETDRMGKGLPDLVSMMSTLTHIGVVTRGLRTGFELVNAGIRAMRGDTEGVWTVLSRLPFGVGEVVREMRDLVSLFDGSAEKAERMKAAVEATGRLQAAAASLAEERTMQPLREIDKLEKQRQERINQILSDVATAESVQTQSHLEHMRPEIDPNVGLGEVTDATRAFADRVNRLRDAQAERERQQRRDEAEQAIKDINELTDEKIEGLYEAERRRVNAEIDAAQKAGIQKEKELARIHREEIEEQMKFKDQLMDLEEETAHRELLAAGKRAEAERREIKKRFEFFRAAADEGQRALIDDLERRQLAAVKEDEEKKEKEKKEKDKDTVATLLSNEFHGLAVQRREAEKTQKRLEEVKEAVEEGTTKIEVAIDKIARTLPKAVLL